MWNQISIERPSAENGSERRHRIPIKKVLVFMLQDSKTKRCVARFSVLDCLSRVLGLILLPAFLPFLTNLSDQERKPNARPVCSSEANRFSGVLGMEGGDNCVSWTGKVPVCSRGQGRIGCLRADAAITRPGKSLRKLPPTLMSPADGQGTLVRCRGVSRAVSTNLPSARGADEGRRVATGRSESVGDRGVRD